MVESFVNLIKTPTGFKVFRTLGPNSFALTTCRQALERFWGLLAERNIL